MKHKIKHNHWHWGDRKVWDGDSRRVGNPDRALLLAVLDQAFQDLRRHLRPIAKARTAKHQKGENDFYASEAYDWFSYKRYTWLCDLVDVTPEAVDMKFKKIVREAHERRANQG